MKVISRKNLPTRLPIYPTIVAALALDHWNAPDWLYGALGLLFVLLWIVAFIRLFKEKDVDILVPFIGSETQTARKSRFQQKMDQVVNSTNE